MAKTCAERQKDYRASRPFAGEKGAGQRQLNTWITTAAFLALRRLSRHQCTTKRATLEKLILEADKAILEDIDESAVDDYLSLVTE